MTDATVMHTKLPPPWREWVVRRAEAMGLPDPDSFLVLLVRLDHQRHTLTAALDDPIAAAVPGE